MIFLAAPSIYLKIEEITIDGKEIPAITWQQNSAGVTKLENDKFQLSCTSNFVYLC